MCWKKQQATLSRWTFPFALASSVLLILLAVTLVDRSDYTFMLAVGCWMFFQPLAVALHELAHALTSLLLGMRLFAVSYGLSGRCLIRRRVFNCDLEVRRSLSGGFTRTAPRSTRSLRLRWALVLAAGPLANALLAGAAFAAVPENRTLAGLVLCFAWSNVIVLGISLFPWKYATSIGVLPSDGLALFTLPFASQTKVQEKHAAYFLMEAINSLRKKDYAAALDWAEKGLRQYPGEVQIRCTLGAALLGLNQFVEARGLFLELAAIDQPPADRPSYKALLLNNVAWTDLMSGDPNRLEEADVYSNRAMRLTPWEPTIKETRGSVLVALGRVDEGIELLKRSFGEHEEKENKASSACLLAIAFNRAGKLAASRHFLEQARSLDPQCPLIDRAIQAAACPSALQSSGESPRDQQAITG
ncbi:MAG TPA: M50 family metallopeptidase [Planctomycetaceae bacterium]|nr:M50 family metallopeptidase [Planctomycetaceae bacterium]